MDKNEKRKQAAGMQNIPLVYGDSMLGSANWVKCRPDLQGGKLRRKVMVGQVKVSSRKLMLRRM